MPQAAFGGARRGIKASAHPYCQGLAQQTNSFLVGILRATGELPSDRKRSREAQNPSPVFAFWRVVRTFVVLLRVFVFVFYVDSIHIYDVDLRSFCCSST